MRIGDLGLLHSTYYDVYARLLVDGYDLESSLGFNPVIAATWTASADQLATQGQISLFRGSYADQTSTSPYLQSSRILPRLRAGQYFQLESAMVAKGAAPSGWSVVFDGRIDGVDAAASGELTQLACRDMMACFMNRIIEPAAPPETPDGKNGFLVPSASLIAHLNTLRATAYPDSAASFLEQQLASRVVTAYGDPQWTVRDTWVQYGRNLAEQMNQAVLQRGWAFDYRYNQGPNSPADFTAYDPGRTDYAAQYTVLTQEVIRVLKCTINDQDVTNVWDLIWGRGSTRTRTRSEDAASIVQYQRRYGSWPEDQAGEIDTQTEADRMLEGMLTDTKDPIIELDYERLYFWPVEVADKHYMVANLIHLDVDLTLAVVGYTHTLTPKSMRTVIRTRGTAVAARRRWKRGSPRMVHVATDETVGIAPEGAVAYVVDDLTPPV